MKNDKKKKERIYRFTEKEYIKAKRDRARLVIIKSHIKKINAILGQVKKDSTTTL